MEVDQKMVSPVPFDGGTDIVDCGSYPYLPELH